MPTTRRKLLLNTVSVDITCSCRKLKLFHIFHPKPRPKKPTYQRHNHYSSSSSSSREKENTTTTTINSTFSPYIDYSQHSDTETEIKSSRSVRGFGRIDGESVAVEKDSDDPYMDFRHSMLQMILENEIYCKDDLRELLNCFLQLNSPYNHGLIVQAFTDIWNGVFSVTSSSPKPQYFGYKSHEF
ncbi:transcription repressor OFP6-like [Juglans microcarpa x Juglans regia]|uniref:transcription repressor OFP6-like n=1 Tax=Juglans microcarpa x Juglans regia TaxID=2249226 RepID=UPI001B7E8F39|nr:transcription repressor OFP6-like [Juglans microcarpa x Juglans regia]